MKKLRTLASVLLLPVLLAGCTVVNTVRVPADPGGKGVFVTAGDIQEPYDSLGMIQVKRGGFLLFGFGDPVGTDLEAGFKETLIPEIEAMGGDGAINVRFEQTQYLPVTQAVFAVLFFIPLPSDVTITAEVVKLQR